MSVSARAYAALAAGKPLEPFSFKRRVLGPADILMDIHFCGVCHSDIHQARNEWGGSRFPMVPGHEIVGVVTKIGSDVKKFKVGDAIGVGCFVDSCRRCDNCRAGLEQYCKEEFVPTYNGIERQTGENTYGGYSSSIVVDENYALRIPKNLDLAKAAPLLCAGITTYSPLKHCGISKNHHIAVIGLGGLGHMAVKIGHALGAQVTVLSSSHDKEKDARRLGANHFVCSRDSGALAKLTGHFDFILNTVSAPIDLAQYLDCLKTDGTMCLVGAPDKPMDLHVFSLITQRRKLMGSLIGGIRETQEMLDFCGAKEIVSEIELIPIQKINEAYERILRSDVKYRFVIDLKSLGSN